ncbi:MAG: NAD-dependent epimerase/dehydratase family protein [Clostridia bacterium]
MRILITGSDGFMGRNLRAALEAADAGELSLIDLRSPDGALEQAALEADFVFHLAGINRPHDPADFMRGNGDFTQRLLGLLEHSKKPPVLLSSSTQAALDNPYGQSKRAAEEAVRAYGERCHTPVAIYRLTNAFGKWSRPNYNSAVATFCYNIAHGLPVTLSDPANLLKLVYIDDIADEFLRALRGSPTREGNFCVVRPEHEIRLGALQALLEAFHSGRDSLSVPDQSDPLTRKLYATYLSFLPPEDFSRFPTTHTDARGSFTELLHMGGHGQVSLNVSKPHIVKGEHWHHTKHEKFIVLTGEGVIRLRKIGDSTVLSYRVSGVTPTIVDIPPGYTHNIENLGDTDMLTLMWANECFTPEHPDTMRLAVQEERSQPK